MKIRELDQDITEKWERGEYGRSEKHVAVVPESADRAMDEALGLKPISIRLPVAMVDALKVIARCHGVAYQPMIRDLLNRFVRSEMIELAHRFDKVREQAAHDEGATRAVDEFLEREKRSAAG